MLRALLTAPVESGEEGWGGGAEQRFENHLRVVDVDARSTQSLMLLTELARL